ncbi:hypothetical protein DRE_00435 [Drechslerella stenobrocha 248]|uniref:SPX domain-containing protein n=1 Tax=Drechslerella stenobrocha 248 TaxID=1043628 RepID=W7I4Y0_9PEZI|nr:hypothetical protein DRE_00435 [Drechslerella stenobrocha 248]
MKFAKQLEKSLVPEWRAKYLNYKGAKKKLKVVRRAIRNAEAASASTLSCQSPYAAAGITQQPQTGSSPRSAATSLKQHLSPDGKDVAVGPSNATSDLSPKVFRRTPELPNKLIPSPAISTPGKYIPTERPSAIPEDGNTDVLKRRKSILKNGTPPSGEPWNPSKHEAGDAGERRHLNPSPRNGPPSTPVGYGSFPSDASKPTRRPSSILTVPEIPSLPPTLDLPGPARPLEDQPAPILRRSHTYDSSLSSRGGGTARRERITRFADDVPDHALDHLGLNEPALDDPKPPTRHTSLPTGVNDGPRPLFKGVFGNFRQRISTPGRHLPGQHAQVYVEVTEDAQREFFNFLASELRKIDDFYESKEREAVDRLARIEQQISIMTRNRLIEKEQEEQAAAEEAAAPTFDWKHPKGIVAGTMMQVKKHISLDKNGAGKLPVRFSSSPSDSKMRPAIANLGSLAIDLAADPVEADRDVANHVIAPRLEDYTRRAETKHVRYKTAKRKLKAALVEYYHSLELLKSYSMLNREGFRKILKKFDKTAHTHLANKYIEEKVNSASFSSNEEVDRLLGRTEDLFAIHYERGRRKHAVERLRTREHRKPATGAMFRSGLYLGMALPLLVQALYEAYNRLEDGYGMRHESEVSYLLQIWAGFALPTLFMLLFSICCRAWLKARINYIFIFEFDTRNNLDWRGLLELPSLCAFIQILLMWFSFTTFWGDGFDRIWFPLIYLIIAILILFNPFKFGYFHSRKWLLYTLYRLVWAGWYPVEFRDFWSGDIFCSLTYTLATIPLFFCLWSNRWDTPAQCNSSNSRLLGFFTTLPSIWRLLQCLRRYYDTRNAFPHLANAAKYACGILYYMMLSLWRIDRSSDGIKAAFILFASVNALYTSTWDLLMDWSLLNWYAPYRLLRTDLAFRRPLVYYLAMVIDPVIRFSWIFFVVFASYVQHSALLSFALSLAELGRRFVWCFFRMENEHCANVNKFRAYRDDVPLPYKITGLITPSRAATTTNTSAASTPVALTPRFSPEAVRITDSEARVDEEIAAVAGSSVIQGGRRPGSSTAAISSGSAEAGIKPRTDSIKDRTPLLRAYTLATTAHAQDFERKRQPANAAASGGGGRPGSSSGRIRGYLSGAGTGYDDDDDSESESGEDAARGGSFSSDAPSAGPSAGAGVGPSGRGRRYSSVSTSGEGTADLHPSRGRGGNGGFGDSSAESTSVGYRGTAAVLDATRSLSEEAAATRAAYSGRDYERSRGGSTAPK